MNEIQARDKAVREIPQQPQAQCALVEQLQLLTVAANKLGLYDAAEWIAACRDVHKTK